MQADFVANDFAAIARAMRREAASPPEAVLHFRDMFALLTSSHENIEAAVEEAYQRVEEISFQAGWSGSMLRASAAV